MFLHTGKFLTCGDLEGVIFAALEESSGSDIWQAKYRKTSTESQCLLLTLPSLTHLSIHPTPGKLVAKC